MKRKDFIKTFGLSLASAPLLLSWLSSCSTNDKNSLFIWMHERKEDSPQQLATLFTKLKSYGVEGIFYGSQNEQHINEIKKAGLKVHSWMWTMNCPDKKVMEEHPEWYAISREGYSCIDNPPYVDYYRWLCPNKEGVKNYLSGKVSKLSDMKMLDGVHLDYVRFCDIYLPIGLQPKYNLNQTFEMPQFDYCYCDDCKRIFKKEYGIDIDKSEDPSKVKEWHQFRLDSVTKIVNMLAKTVHSKGKLISAAVFPTPDMSARMVRQDWGKWNLDIFAPMLYHNFYEKDIDWIISSSKEGLKSLNNNQKLYAGLFIPEISGSKLRTYIKKLKENGLHNYSFFDYNSLKEDHWKEIKDLI